MSIQKLDDKRLVNLYIKGNEEALAVLVKRHKQKVYSCIYFLVRDRELAEDFFQDTFIKVIQCLKGGQYYEDSKFGPWVLRIAHNLVIDYFRKNKKRRTISSVKNEDGEETDIFWVLVLEEEEKSTDEKQYIKKTMRHFI